MEKYATDLKSKQVPRIRIYLLFFMTLLLLSSCAKRKSIPSAYQLPGGNNGGEVVNDTVYVQNGGEAIFRSSVKAGLNENLYIGHYEDFTAWSILRFSNLPDTNSVESAQLTLQRLSYEGEGSSFLTSVHLITQEWTESTVSWSDLQNGFDPSDLFSLQISPSDSDQLVIDIAPDIINNWIDSSVVNYGLLFKPEGADFLQEFGSSDNLVTSNYPNLRIIYRTQENSELDTLTIYPAADATLFDYEGLEPKSVLLPADPFLRVGNASGFRSFLEFDLSSIPSNATIYRSLLQLSINSASSETSVSGISYGIYPISEGSINEPDSLTFVSVAIPTGIAASDYKVLGNMSDSDLFKLTSIVQNWVSGDVENKGFILKSLEEGHDTSYLSFYNALSTDKSLVPKLIITYSESPSSQFDN